MEEKPLSQLALRQAECRCAWRKEKREFCRFACGGGETTKWRTQWVYRLPGFSSEVRPLVRWPQFVQVP